jgi:hypothetical protein
VVSLSGTAPDGSNHIPLAMHVALPRLIMRARGGVATCFILLRSADTCAMQLCKLVLA